MDTGTDAGEKVTHATGTITIVYPKYKVPSQDVLDSISKIHPYFDKNNIFNKHHTENVIKDFQRVIGDGFEQWKVDIMFFGFVAGILNTINPEAEFNKNFYGDKK